jgi:uncharacterized protein with FMN-binding domain
MKSTYNENTPKIIGGAVIGFIALAALYFFILSPINEKNNSLTTESSTTNSSQNTGQSSNTSSTNSSQAQANTSSSASYKNGTYTAQSSYMVPHGQNTISVQMSVENGSITAVKTSHNYSDQESAYYVESFDSLIEQKVVGKSLSNLSVGRVGGASLTSSAFDDAIATIKNEAKT